MNDAQECPHPPRPCSFDAIAEGICPRCFSALDRADDHGLCPCCGMGWSLHGDTVGIHIGVTSTDLSTGHGRFLSGPGTLTVLRPAE